MKLATFTKAGAAPRIGAVDPETRTIRDLQQGHVDATGAESPIFVDMIALMNAGEVGLAAAARAAEKAPTLPLDDVRLLAPVPLPPQIRDFSCFEKHLRGAPAGMTVLKARLAGEPVPDIAKIDIPLTPIYVDQPIWYISNRFNVVGHETQIEWPVYSDYLDFELEFGIFIGRGGKNISRADAGRHVFGYCLFNDFSARDQQGREMSGFMGPTKGKSFDTGNVIGPWIVTADEIGDIQGRKACVRVNGEVWASSTTSNMMHTFEDMIAFVSRSETLHVGEFFGSGTIGGCCGLEMDRWLKDGDVVELDIEGLGVLRNRVVRSR